MENSTMLWNEIQTKTKPKWKILRLYSSLAHLINVFHDFYSSSIIQSVQPLIILHWENDISKYCFNFSCTIELTHDLWKIDKILAFGILCVYLLWLAFLSVSQMEICRINLSVIFIQSIFAIHMIRSIVHFSFTRLQISFVD